MLTVVVDFDIDPEQLEAFVPLMRENAATSLAAEPGCHQFDVCVSTEDPSKILLYEVYDDEAAFEAHLASAHFRTFSVATEGMITGRSIRRFMRNS